MTTSNSRRGFSLIELLVVLGVMALLIALLLPAVQHAREAGARTQCLNNLKQIGLGLQQYHDAGNVLPPGMIPDDGVTPYPWLSWQARVLPYLELEALWQQTQDSYNHNRSPFFRMPSHPGMATVVPVFICPSDGRESALRPMQKPPVVAFTHYLGVNGTNLNTKDGVLFCRSAIRFAAIRDGLSNTIMVGERPPSPDAYYGWWYAGQGIDDTGAFDMILGARELNTGGLSIVSCPKGPYNFAPGQVDNMCDVPHFWSQHPYGANFVFADGSARLLPYSAKAILPALATCAGGEVVTVPN